MMPFGLDQIRRAFERSTFNNQILLSVVMERPLIAEDFDKLCSDDLGSKIGMHSMKMVYLSLTHKEQKSLLEICLKNTSVVEEICMKLDSHQAKLQNIIINTVLNENNTDEEVISVIYDVTIDFLNDVFMIIANNISKIPASIFKKIIVVFLKTGINKEMMIQYLIEQTKKQLKHDNTDEL